MADENTIVQKIVITADTSDADKKLGSFGQTAGKAAQAAGDSLGKLGTSLAGILPNIGTLAIGALAAGAALVKMASSAVATGVELGKLVQATGASTESLSTMVLTFSSFGASSATAAAAIETFSRRVSEASRTAAADMRASTNAVIAAQQKLSDISVQSGNLDIRQTELNYAKRKELYGRDMTAREKHDLQLAKLDQQQAEIDNQRAKQAVERAKAEEDLRNARANDYGRLRAQLSGIGPIVLDARTKFENFTKAVAQSIAGAKDRVAAFLAIYDRIVDPQVKADLAKNLGLDKLIPALKEGESALQLYQQRQEQIARAGLALTTGQKNNLIDLGRAWDRLSTDVGAAMVKIGAVVAPVITTVLNFLAQEIEDIGHDLQTIAEEVKHSWEGLQTIWAWIAYAAKSAAEEVVAAWNAVVEFFKKLWKDYIQDPAKAAWDTVTGYFNAAAETILSYWRPVAQFFADLWATIRSIIGQGPAAASDASGLPMAGGGMVRGPSGIDVIPALLTAGEFVFSRQAVSRWGTNVLASMNALGVPRLGSGGLVGALPAFAGGGPVSAGRSFTLSIEGRSFSGLAAPAPVAEAMQRFAVNSQIASTGRKQSWKR